MSKTPAHDHPEVAVLREYNQSASNFLKDLLFGDKLEKREQWDKLFQDPIFNPDFRTSLEEQKEQAYQRIKRVTEAKIVSIFDFQNDPTNIYTAHEMLGYVDASLSTKFTVQFNLFGGSLIALHSERHLPFMRKVDSLENMGCFCFTELGFGNNAPKMETTATYDKQTQEFVINSPTTLSQKYWITNGSAHSNQAIVFAQTIVEGKNEGVNAFIVQIREKNHKPSPGVMIEDMGDKMALNGVDNGRLMFDHVRIKRENMLNALCDVSPEGVFTSDIKKKSARFFKVTDRLLSGRLCIAAMSMAAQKRALHAAVRYSQQRLAVGESGESDTPIMSYQLQQNAIVPMVAKTIVYNIGLNAAKKFFANPAGKENDIIKTLCALKAMVSWHSADVGTVCRERCGGAAYLAYNIIPLVIIGGHSGMTAEGDNSVLMQKVVKDILTHTREKTHHMPRLSKSAIANMKNLPYASAAVTLKNLIYLKEQVEIKEIIAKLQQKVFENGEAFYDVWMKQLSDEILSTANAFGNRFFLQNAMEFMEVECVHPGALRIMGYVIYLYMITQVRKDAGWYLERGLITREAAKHLDSSFNKAVKDLVPHLNDCVEAFGIPKNQELYAPVERDYIAFNAQRDMNTFGAAGPVFDFQKGATQQSQRMARL